MPTVRTAIRVSLLHLVAVSLCCISPRAFSANLDTTADHVLGQVDFSTKAPATTANGLSFPFDIAIDRRTGRIWVSDEVNNRVLSYPSAASMANGAAADFVLGQPNFTSGTVNNGGLSATSLNIPLGVALDAAGNVFVSDHNNHRVLMYKQPLTTDAVADVVFGQANFTSGAPGTTATTLNNPTHIALDGNGNLFVADFSNNRVLRFSPPFTNGMSASLVLGQPDFVSGTANNGGILATSLFGPEGMAFDPSNNLYVTDLGNNRVLKYAAGFGSHAAASSVYGQGGVFTTNTPNNGGLTASSLANPFGLSLDPFNNLYISDSGNHRVVEYSSGTTGAANLVFGQPNSTSGIANNGGVSATSLSNPLGCVSDNAGNLLIADSNNNRVLEYDLPITASAPTFSLLFPAVMAAGSPDFTLYLTGTNFINTSVVQINGVARPTTFTGFTTLRASLTAADVAGVGLAAITVMTPAPGGGVTNLRPLSIYQRIPNDTIADRLLGQPDFATATISLSNVSAHSLLLPYGLTIDPTGRLWACDLFNNRILSWANAAALSDGKDADFVLGQSDFSSNSAGTSATALLNPGGVAVDPAGNVYVADTGNNRILIFNDPLHTDAVADVVLGQADFVSRLAHGGGAVSAANFNSPYGLALDASGNLYVSDFSDNRVLRFSPPFVTNMNASQVIGQPDFTTLTPNTGGASAATLNNPVYLAVDSEGNLYVPDDGNNRVLEYNTPATTDGIADHVFGQPDFTTVTPNTGGVSASSMHNPVAVALDPAGNLYVGEITNNRILAFNSPLTSNGTANRVFGQGGSFTSNTPNNGGLNSGSLASPIGLAVDAKYNVYIADEGNNRILIYDHVVENPPAVSSAAQATPNPVLVGQTVNFTVAGTDPENDTLTYLWDFADGTTGAGASVSHAYSLNGTFNATVIIDDGFGGTTTSSVMVTVKAPHALGDIKLAIKLNFAKPNSDMIFASGTVELPAGAISGTATVQVADLIETFTMTTSSATNADGKFSVASKGATARAAKFKLTLSKKTFAASFVSAGLVNMNVVTPVHVPITLTINGEVYQATVSLTYTGKQGVSGKTK